MSWLFNGTINQKKTPAFYADVLASRPAAGYDGRIFIATDSPYGIYRDNGSIWVQIAGNGSVTGTGTAGTIVKFTSAGVIGNSIITESGTTINIAGKAVVRPTIAGEYAQTYLQQNAATSGWSWQADNSGNFNLVRLNNGVYAAIAFSWTSAGTITTNGNSVTIGAVIGTGTGVLYSQRNFFTATNYGTTGTPVYEEIVGYSYDGNSKFAIDACNSYTNNQGTGFRFKITSYAGAAIYPLSFTNAVGDATFSGTLGINGIADNVKGGTYTPTESGAINCNTFTFTQFRYIRVGNICKVQGSVTFTRTSNNTYFDISLPIASTLTTGEGSGLVTSTTNLSTGYIASTVSNTIGVSTNNTVATGTLSYFLEFTYIIQ